jgi:hypothetical protein
MKNTYAMHWSCIVRQSQDSHTARSTYTGEIGAMHWRWLIANRYFERYIVRESGSLAEDLASSVAITPAFT